MLRLEEPATHPEAAPQALERLVPTSSASCRERHLGARRLSSDRLSRRRQHNDRFGRNGDRQPRAEASGAPCSPTKPQRSNPASGFDAFALTAEWTES